MAQLWPRPKLAINLKMFRQKLQQAEEDVGTEETIVITPETSRKVLTNIIRVKLRRL